LKKHYQANQTALPLTAGAIGYVSYDYGLALHGMKSRHAPAFPLPDMKWVFYDFFIIEHRQSHAVWFAANGQTMPAEALIAQMEEKIRTRLQEKPLPHTDENSQYALTVQADSTPETYGKALQKLRDYLFAGDVYVTNFTSTLTVQSH
jgi:para-aminobenzoate synthetase component 1